MMLGTLLAGCAGGQSGEKTAEGDTIKLGFLGAKTGSVAHYGLPGEKGMKWH
jgi:branched-chain amino acid transport system substrate-binding protein